MEQDIDLRPFLRALRRHWLYILVIGGVFAAAAFLLTNYVLTRYYTAEALVYLAPPPLQVNLDQTVSVATFGERAFQPLTRLALSDTVVQRVIEDVGDELSVSAPRTVGYFQRNVLFTQSQDGALLRLTVRWSDPDDAVRIAEVWARVFSEDANMLLGYRDPARVISLDAQRADAQAMYEAAQDALAAYQAGTSVSVLEANRDVLRDDYIHTLTQINRIERSLIEADTLRTILTAKPDGSDVSPSDSLSLIMFQMRAFSEATPEAEPAIQIDAAAGLGDGQTYGDLLDQLDAYEGGLRQQQAVLEGELESMVGAIEAAERDLQAAVSELTLLQSEVERTYAAVQSIATAINSLRVSGDALGDVVRIAALPVTPQEPSEPRVMVATMVSGVMGLVFGLLVVVLVAYLRAPEPAPIAGSADPARSSAAT